MWEGVTLSINGYIIVICFYTFMILFKCIVYLLTQYYFLLSCILYMSLWLG